MGTETAWNESHGARVLMGWGNGLPKFPLTMSKVTFVTEFAAFSGIVFGAQAALHRRRGGIVWDVGWWWCCYVSRGWTGPKIQQMGHSFIATGDIVKEVAVLTKWTARSTTKTRKPIR